MKWLSYWQVKMTQSELDNLDPVKTHTPTHTHTYTKEELNVR